MRLHLKRQGIIRKLRAKLERDSYPRLQMMLIIFITGAAGFAASFGLLRTGINDMWLRYPLAVGVAYLAFLLLLWLWLRTKADDWASVEIPAPANDCSDNSTNLNEADPLGEAISATAQADEIAIPLMILLFLAIAVLSTLWIVYTAPALFAELLVDGALAGALYRRLRRAESRHWLTTAIQLSWRPFLITAIVLSASGFAMVEMAPEARTFSEFLHYSESE
jgi:hypothetical protein